MSAAAENEGGKGSDLKKSLEIKNVMSGLVMKCKFLD